jgi:phosphoglycerate-specific signal transduction histidine kinase
MNQIVIKDTEKFEEVIDNIEKELPSIKNTFQSEARNSVDMSGTDVWKGQAQEKLYEKYKQLEQNFTPIEETIALYVRFLRKTLEDYIALENSLNAKIDEYSGNQLDVNS